MLNNSAYQNHVPLKFTEVCDHIEILLDDICSLDMVSDPEPFREDGTPCTMWTITDKDRRKIVLVVLDGDTLVITAAASPEGAKGDAGPSVYEVVKKDERDLEFVTEVVKALMATAVAGAIEYERVKLIDTRTWTECVENSMK